MEDDSLDRSGGVSLPDSSEVKLQTQEGPVVVPVHILMKKPPIPYSRVILLVFCLAEISISIQYMTCAPIAVPLSKIYNVDSLLIGSTATMQMFLFPVFTIPATWTANKFGLNFTVKLGSLIILTGTLMRCICILNDKFIWVVLGSFMMGIGRPFIINLQGDLAVTWFLPERRTQIMSLLNFLVTMSLVTGTVLASLSMYGYDEKDPDVVSWGRRRFNFLLIVEFAISSFSYLSVFLFFRKRVVTRPPPENIKQETMLLIRNWKFISIFMAFTFCFGTFKGFSVALPFMINYYGYEPSDMALLAVAPIIGGMISSCLVARAYKKTGRYKPWVVGIQFITSLLFIFNYLGMKSGRILLLAFINLILGFTIMPSVPLLIEWGCKCAFPVSDAFAIGILYSGATLGGALFGEIQIKLVKGDQADATSIFVTLLFMAGCYVLAMIITVCTTEVKSRQKTIISEALHSDSRVDHQKTHSINSQRSHMRKYTVSNSIDVNNVILVEGHEDILGAYDFAKDSVVAAEEALLEQNSQPNSLKNSEGKNP